MFGTRCRNLISRTGRARTYGHCSSRRCSAPRSAWSARSAPEIVPRSAHVIQAQILLAIVGAMIIIVVAESLARAFAIVGAAGLVRYRARIKDPKDAGVMLVALAVGLTAGSGMFLFAAAACVFRHRRALGARVAGTGGAVAIRFEDRRRNSAALKPDIEHALESEGGHLRAARVVARRAALRGHGAIQQKIRPLTKLIRSSTAPHHAGRSGRRVRRRSSGRSRKYKTVRP